LPQHLCADALPVMRTIPKKQPPWHAGFMVARVRCLAVVVVAACTSGDQAVVVTDSTEDSFRIFCVGATCDVDVVSADVPMPECDETETPGYSFFVGRFIDITAACIYDDGTWVSWGHWGRPAACRADSDCPPLLEHEFECRVGLCQSIDLAAWPEPVVSQSDVWLLCSAPVPRSATIGAGADVQTFLDIGSLVDEACGDGAPLDATCALPLPDGCLQPR